MDPNVKENPLISVIMPVYNAGEYIGEAIESILKQSFADFELLIFNDGSCDNSLEIIKSYKDNRIRLFDSASNQGYLVHLNRGLEIASGTYIARMDADDISFPDRFMEQVNVLETQPETGVCGSWVRSFGEIRRVISYPESDEEIKISLLSRNSFAHPAVMIRKAVLVKNNVRYNQDFYTSEDYKMWADLVPYTKFYNIPRVLLKYRVTRNQITSKFNHLQFELSKKTKLAQLRYLGIDPSEEESEFHIKMMNWSITDINGLQRIDIWINILMEANEKSGLYRQNLLASFLKELKKGNIKSYVINEIYNSKNKSIDLLKELFFSDYQFYRYLTFNQKVKIIFKYILKK